MSPGPFTVSTYTETDAQWVFTGLYKTHVSNKIFIRHFVNDVNLFIENYRFTEPRMSSSV